jgi:glycerol-3-phosphate O-acyltransferase
MKLNAAIAHDITFTLQRNLRMMPTTLVASILLLYRKGISRSELETKVGWLGMIINERTWR